MKDIIEKLKELRKEVWHDLHNREAWGVKDRVIKYLDEAIKELTDEDSK